MIQLNKRQSEILDFIKRNPNANSSAILQYISENFENTSKITIIRDLNLLLGEKLITKQGEGRNIAYKEITQNKFLEFIDVDKYFMRGPDEREVAYKSFNFNIFNNLDEIFSKGEIKKLN